MQWYNGYRNIENQWVVSEVERGHTEKEIDDDDICLCSFPLRKNGRLKIKSWDLLYTSGV